MRKIQTLKIAGPVFLLLVGAVAFARARGPETQSPKTGRVVEGIYGLGTVNADQVYTAKTGVSLQLQQIPVKEGDQVKEGDVLARFEESAVRAPFSGTVTQVAFKAGEIVPPQSPVLTITSLDRLYLEVNLEQQSVLLVSPGKAATVSFESLRGQRFNGKVKNIYPRDSQFIVRIEMDAWPQGVLPGMTADVAIEANSKENALLIPVKSVDDGKVELVRDGSRTSADVKLGTVTGDWVEVAAGDVRPSDQLVLQDQ
jgi:membrane fusion protein, macrolide-specific efflux system